MGPTTMTLCKELSSACPALLKPPCVIQSVSEMAKTLEWIKARTLAFHSEKVSASTLKARHMWPMCSLSPFSKFGRTVLGWPGRRNFRPHCHNCLKEGSLRAPGSVVMTCPFKDRAKAVRYWPQAHTDGSCKGGWGSLQTRVKLLRVTPSGLFRL